jgi:RimJ/RimL family protein N-acetyltransferase
MRPDSTGAHTAGESAVRRAHRTDLEALVSSLGQRRYFTDRLRRQAENRGVLLASWLDHVPVGVVYLWLEPADEPEIRHHLPGVPLLQHLEVRPDHRHRGIGSEVVQAACHYLWRLGHQRVALAVDVDNHQAMRLYVRLGFREWNGPAVRCYIDRRLADGDGVGAGVGLGKDFDLCRILVKTLANFA